MNKALKLVLICLFFNSLTLHAQDSVIYNPLADSLRQSSDSAPVLSDTAETVMDSVALDTSSARIFHGYKKNSWQQDTAFTKLFSFSGQRGRGKTKFYDGREKKAVSGDMLFYCLLFIVFFLALTKAAFPKYFNNIFSLSFQATFRQSQTREQITQNQLPGLMLNLLFILSGGLFIALLAGYYKWSSLPFAQLFLYSAVILSLVYSGKFLFIQFAGWVFNARAQAGEYSFIVFLINKLIGISLVPLAFLVAYTDEPVKKISITISLCLILFLIILRYIISMSRLRKNMQISAFHFFIYLCAVEVMPMLVVYKILFIQTGNKI